MKTKTERFKITGVSHYVDNIVDNLVYENPDYELTNKELIEEYDDGDRVFEYGFDDSEFELIPEPENQHDKNAVRVDVKGFTIGYVKSGSCSRVKNLLKSSDYAGKSLDMGGGNYKRIYEDYDTEKLKVEEGSTGYFADLEIYIRVESDSVPAADPVPAATEKPKKGGLLSRLFKK